MSFQFVKQLYVNRNENKYDKIWKTRGVADVQHLLLTQINSTMRMLAFGIVLALVRNLTHKRVQKYKIDK